MIKLVTNDVGQQIRCELTRENDGSVVDLTDRTTTLKMRKKGETSVLFTLSNLSTGEDAENGIAIFALQAGNLNVAAGKYEAEVSSSTSGGDIETVYELIDFTIRDELA